MPAGVRSGKQKDGASAPFFLLKIPMKQPAMSLPRCPGRRARAHPGLM